MSIKVRNGVALIDSGDKVFVGATSTEGEFPPTNVEYKDFMCSPEQGTSGTLLFFDARLRRMTAGSETSSYYFYQFMWEENKLVIKYEHERALFSVGKSDTLGFYLKVGKTLYLTGNPEASSEYIYRRVRPLDLFAHLEGKIDLNELRKRSLKFRLEQVKSQSLDNRVRLLETALRETKKSHRRASQDIETLIAAGMDLADIIRAIPRWLTWLCLWKQPSRREPAMTLYQQS